MNVQVQTVNFEADKKLVDFISRKMEKATTFHDRILETAVYLRLDNVVHKIKDKVVEITIKVPGYRFFVKTTSKSFEESFDAAFNSIINQIKRRKEKLAA